MSTRFFFCYIFCSVEFARHGQLDVSIIHKLTVNRVRNDLESQIFFYEMKMRGKIFTSQEGRAELIEVVERIFNSVEPHERRGLRCSSGKVSA